ncbi:hypothetical protein GUITHDRAFT_154279, partial [Guillardia theta CCMP2712]
MSKVVESVTKAAQRMRKKIYFPNRIMYFMPNQQSSDVLDMVKLRVPPSMHKFEIKDWVEAGYDTPVKKVHTANYEGRLIRYKHKNGFYKRPDYKVAYVYLETPWTVPK